MVGGWELINQFNSATSLCLTQSNLTHLFPGSRFNKATIDI